MGLTKPRAEQILNLDYKQATRVISTTNVNLNGGAPSEVDGVNLSLDDRILVTGQSTGSENGIYYVEVLGNGSNGTWLRTSDSNTTGEIEAGMIIMVTEGTVYADTQWKLTTNDPIIIGTSALTFVINAVSLVGGANTQIQYNAGGTLAGTANLTWSGTEIFVNGTANVTGNITGNYILGNGSQLTGISAGGGNSISNGTSNVVVAASGPVSIAVAGANIISITSAGIINNQANALGNIGNSTGYFNTIFAKATSAQYADLAEMYVADAAYPAGTVVEFGGEFEITLTRTSHSTKIAGIVSTNPSYLMNATQSGNNVLPIALTGRVPCQVVGTIAKGDRLVASDYMGAAQRLDPDKYQPGCIIGKSLEDYDSETIGLIEIAVGRF